MFCCESSNLSAAGEGKKEGKKRKKERKKEVSNLVFYAQSTIAVISGREKERERKKERKEERKEERKADLYVSSFTDNSADPG